jgi:putative oxidoreductase
VALRTFSAPAFRGIWVLTSAIAPVCGNLFSLVGGNSLRFLDRLQPLALLVLRVVLGAIMIGHGYGKVFGGLSHFVQFIGGLGLPSWLAYASAVTEFFGGILVIAGLFTRCVSLAILIDLGVVIWKVHWKHGFLGSGGYEFPLAVAAVAFALIFFGGGPMAFDSIRKGGGGGRGKSKPA